jgi:hypothetical protein
VDGRDVPGRLYVIRLQSAKSGLVEVTVSQLWPAGAPVRVVRPEGVKATRWFGLVRTFLDGEVEARVAAGSPDAAEWADLPFLPTGLERTSVLRSYAARAPYVLEVAARRHRIEEQADAVVLSARAEVVVGLDGDARVRVRYRLFNRSRQFLRLRLPEGAVLYGAVAAGRTVKPLAGADGGVLLPVPKVPLGGTGYEVSLTYRARAGADLREGGTAVVPLPEVEGVEVDRTAIELRVPEGFDYDFDTRMTAATEREAIGDEVEAALREAKEVLKVAQTGTLEQRMFACDNGAPLLAQASQRLDLYRAQGARADRVQVLAAELDKVTAAQREAQMRCAIDARAAEAEERNRRATVLGAADNAGSLVVLDDVTNGLDVPQGGSGGGGSGGGIAGGGAGGSSATANWRFNAEAIPLESAGKKDLLDLKSRLQSELERRDQEERRKSVDVVQEGQERSRAQQVEAAEAATKAPAQQKQEAAAADEETLLFDQSRNIVAQNEQILRVQTRQRQLGAEVVAGQAANAFRGRASVPQTEDATSLAPSNFTPPEGPPEPSYGWFLSAGDGHDVDFRGRAENVFSRPGGPAMRVGLMGIDVPLPDDGRVFWFVAPRAGSPLALDASPLGTPTWVRVLLGLGLLAALLVGLRRLARRARSA